MKNKKGNMFIIIIAIGVIILIIISIRTAFSKKKVNLEDMSEEEITAYIDEKISNIERDGLADLGERDRMEHYVSKFISSIENEKYDSAYEMLYDDFKKNYFPTYDSFVEYASQKFPKFAAIEHTNIERNGDLYILWTKFSDSLGSKDSYKEIRFVVRENELNDFDISFSVEL